MPAFRFQHYKHKEIATVCDKKAPDRELWRCVLSTLLFFEAGQNEWTHTLEIILHHRLADIIVERAVPIGIASQACHTADAPEVQLPALVLS